MFRARGRKAQREKELKRRRVENIRQAKLNKELEVIQWEKDLLAEPLNSHMKSMWEVRFLLL